ncbi:MAG: hypothetical protein ABI686_05815 [Acidobacteriota bacterium]
MPEKTKRKEETKPAKKIEPQNADEENWNKNQREKSYYYDDSHGYEIYNPDEEDEEDGE